MSRLPDGTPILCKQCGGEAELAPDLGVRCTYCGAQDALPPDELGRALDIRGRLALAAGRVAQLEGMDGALASIFSDPRAIFRAVGLYLVVGLFSLASALASTVSLIDSPLGVAAIVDAAAASLMAPLVVLSCVAWAGIAMARGRRVFESAVRPLLLARPPAAEGAPFGCRACGGPLARAVDTVVACTFCRTKNLVPRSLHAAHAGAADARTGALKDQVHAASARTTGVAAVMRNTFLVGSGASAVLIVVGIQLLRILLRDA